MKKILSLSILLLTLSISAATSKLPDIDTFISKPRTQELSEFHIQQIACNIISDAQRIRTHQERMAEAKNLGIYAAKALAPSYPNKTKSIANAVENAVLANQIAQKSLEQILQDAISNGFTNEQHKEALKSLEQFMVYKP